MKKTLKICVYVYKKPKQNIGNPWSVITNIGYLYKKPKIGKQFIKLQMKKFVEIGTTKT